MPARMEAEGQFDSIHDTIDAFRKSMGAYVSTSMCIMSGAQEETTFTSRLHQALANNYSREIHPNLDEHANNAFLA